MESVGQEQLLTFAGWLPVWIRGRQDPSVAIPLPPHPSHVFGQSLRTTDYAWTVAAWDAYSRWHKQDPRLPWYAIPASKLAPAASEPGLQPDRYSAAAHGGPFALAARQADSKSSSATQ